MRSISLARHATASLVMLAILTLALGLGYPLLVTGGSQGAKVMADVIPATLMLLSPEERACIVRWMRARGEDKSRVAAACARMGFPVELAEFFADVTGLKV